MSTDNGATWVDMTNFFMNGATGWVDVTVSGDFVPAGGPALPPPSSVPALNAVGLAALGLALMLATLLVLRRRSA